MYDESTELKKLSCGILLMDQYGKMLLCHVSEQVHWDIPKGTQKDLESTPETMARKLFEETGVTILNGHPKDLGWFEYNLYKDIWLYLGVVENLDVNKLQCNGFYHDSKMRKLPKSDEFRLIPIEEVERYMCGSMRTIFSRDLTDYIKRAYPSLPVIEIKYQIEG